MKWAGRADGLALALCAGLSATAQAQEAGLELLEFLGGVDDSALALHEQEQPVTAVQQTPDGADADADAEKEPTHVE